MVSSYYCASNKIHNNLIPVIFITVHVKNVTKLSIGLLMSDDHSMVCEEVILVHFHKFRQLGCKEGSM